MHTIAVNGRVITTDYTTFVFRSKPLELHPCMRRDYQAREKVPAAVRRANSRNDHYGNSEELFFKVAALDETISLLVSQP